MATQQLVTWLKRTMASDTNSLAIYQYSHEESLYREMIFTCLHAGLLEYQEHDTDVIYYTLTDNGKRALELADSEGEQSSTPQAATVPTEYSISAATEEAMGWQETSRRATVPTGEYVAIRDNVYIPIDANTDRHVGWYPGSDAKSVAETLNTETHALREKNAKLQTEIAEYKASLSRQAANSLQVERELQAARERVEYLDAQLQMLADDGVIEDVGLSRWKKIRVNCLDTE